MSFVTFVLVSVCAEGWVPNNLTAAASGLCYKLVSSPRNWTAARRECEEAAPHHGDLASVPDEATNLFLMSLTEAGAWIGGFRDRSLGWRWSDGSAWRYQAWHPRQPNNYGTREDRVEINWEGNGFVGWNDGWGKYKLGFICQYRGKYLISYITNMHTWISNIIML